MKIKELIEVLLKEDPEMKIVLSRDSEGNGYSPLSDYGDMFYREMEPWYGVGVHPDDLQTEDLESIKKVFCLWPLA